MKHVYYRRRLFARCLITIVLLCAATRTHGAESDYLWANRAGDTGSDRGFSVAVDSAGNVFVTGEFVGTADFDPGPGTSILTSASWDVFVCKFDSAGNLLWAKVLGGPGIDRFFYGPTLAVDAAGDVCITGGFVDTADFDPGPGTANLTSFGESDIFVCKLDSLGNYVWARQLGGSSFDMGQSIAVDTYGNVYTTGYFQDTADFDPSAGTADLTSAGFSEVFVCKLDSSGSYVWSKQFKGFSHDEGACIKVDPAGNVYTTGFFSLSVDFDPGPGTATLNTAGSYDTFICKLDNAGNYAWAERAGGSGWDRGCSLAVDSAGNVYTTGWFEATADFDPGPGTANLVSGGTRDIFIWKLDGSGDYVWAKSMGAAASDAGYSVVLDASDRIVFTGGFAHTVDFDPGPGTANLVSPDTTSVFICKLDSAGNYVWAKRAGGTRSAYGYSLALDSGGSILLAGEFAGVVDFDPGPGTANLTSAGNANQDNFVLKLGDTPDVLSSIRANANPTNATSVDFTVQFSEPVTGIDVSDFALTTTGGITGASVTNVSGTDTTWTVTVNTGSGDGTVRLDVVDDDSIVNALLHPLAGTGAGNGDFTAGESYTVVKTGPTVTLSSTASNPAYAAIAVDVTLSDATTEFDIGDITVTNATASGFGGSGITYSFTLTPAVEGVFTAQVPAGVFTDALGNANTASNVLSYVYDDLAPPGIAISAPSKTLTSSDPVSYTVTYTNAVFVRLLSPSLTLNTTGTATGTVTTGGSGLETRTVTISDISGNGTLGISIAAGTAVDAGFNFAEAAGPSETFVVDNDAPGIAIGPPSLGGTNTGPVSYTVTYTGADTVTLADSDVALITTGTATGTVALSGTGSAMRTVTITGITGDGGLGITIGPGTASDDAGNKAAASGPSATFDVDSDLPVLPVTSWLTVTCLLVAMILRFRKARV